MATPKKYTSFDIAEMAGVSQTTVSRALSGSQSVAESTRQRIVEITDRLHYQVDLSARRLRTQQTRTITLLMFADEVGERSKLNPFYLSMLGGIVRAAAMRNYDVLVSFQQLSQDWFADYERNHKSDGLILLGYGDFNELDERLVQLLTQGTHFVRWGVLQQQQQGVAVGCDNIRGSKHATQHLVALGRKRIAFIGDITQHSPEFRDRFVGYQQALEDAGIPFNSALQCDAGVNIEFSGAVAVQRLLKNGVHFDGIVAASDQIAITAIRALTAAGKRVPKDVAVVGFDDIPLAGLINPPLTTVRQNTERAGEHLVDKLIKLIHQQPVENQLLDTELIVRESCGAAMASTECRS